MIVSKFKSLLREPLIQFLILGIALFVGYGYFTRNAETQDMDYRVLLTPDELLQMTVYFESQWKRPPTQEEFGHLLELKVKEEILYREALAMGLDKDDTIVKRRMAQKMQFLAEDVGAAREPETNELKQWYEQNSQIFAMPGRVSFRQIYFSPQLHRGRIREDAEQALEELQGQPIDSPLIADIGDSIMLQDYFGDRSVETLAKELGPSFAQAVMQTTPGSWQGPFESGLGWHLVFVDSLEPGRVPDFTEVAADVKTAWLAQQKAVAWEKSYEEMRARYSVFLPDVPEELPDTELSADAPENQP